MTDAFIISVGLNDIEENCVQIIWIRFTLTIQHFQIAISHCRSLFQDALNDLKISLHYNDKLTNIVFQK